MIPERAGGIVEFIYPLNLFSEEEAPLVRRVENISTYHFPGGLKIEFPMDQVPFVDIDNGKLSSLKISNGLLNYKILYTETYKLIFRPFLNKITPLAKKESLDKKRGEELSKELSFLTNKEKALEKEINEIAKEIKSKKARLKERVKIRLQPLKRELAKSVSIEEIHKLAGEEERLAESLLASQKEIQKEERMKKEKNTELRRFKSETTRLKKQF